MKISELIMELMGVKKEEGDLEVGRRVAGRYVNVESVRIIDDEDLYDVYMGNERADKFVEIR